jgi:hydroxymethylglutaryl-CoA synthase
LLPHIKNLLEEGNKKHMNVGILGYGMYIPKYRIKVSDVASVWGKNASDIELSLGVTQKTVAAYDEDAVTIAYEAALRACVHAQIKPSELEVCFVGSESHPYAVNPTSTIVAEFLGVGHKYLSSDLQFACKAATTGLIAASGLIGAGHLKKGMVIGSDAAQAKPHDILEYTAAAGGVACILGENDHRSIASIQDFTSFSSDTPDFWRRDGVRFPSHGGRFTGEPAYFTHVMQASKILLSKTHMAPADFDYCVFHMPNGKFPIEVAKRLHFSKEQLAPSLTVHHIGNPYSAASLMGLSAVLDIAKPNQNIFFVSYGSGAGSDAFVIKTNDALLRKRKKELSFAYMTQTKEYISYVDYLRKGKKI